MSRLRQSGPIDASFEVMVFGRRFRFADVLYTDAGRQIDVVGPFRPQAAGGHFFNERVDLVRVKGYDGLAARVLVEAGVTD